jgi:hypothetical protein
VERWEGGGVGHGSDIIAITGSTATIPAMHAATLASSAMVGKYAAIKRNKKEDARQMRTTKNL